MLKVGDLIKHLSENNPEDTPARLTLYNYLVHLADEDASVSVELLENFFAVCLDYAHWQQNPTQVGEEVRELLADSVDFTGLKWPEETQILEIEHVPDLTDALQCYLNSIYKKGEKYRLIVEPDKRVMAIVLLPDHSICVRTFDRKMMIRHGQLEPLKKDLALYYTADLELDPTQVQKMEMAPFVIAQFQADSDGLDGCLVRGYTCQKFFDLKGENIASYPKLFYAIKKMEQNFINRQTDPFYQQTVTALERTIESVRLGDPDATQKSMDVLAQAQNAVEYVFTSDKLLNLLIRDLQHTLALRKNSEGRSQVRTSLKIEPERSRNEKIGSDRFGQDRIERTEYRTQIDNLDLIDELGPDLVGNESRVVRTPQKVEDAWTINPSRSLNQSQKQALKQNQTQSQPLPSRKRERKFDLTN